MMAMRRNVSNGNDDRTASVTDKDENGCDDDDDKIRGKKAHKTSS